MQTNQPSQKQSSAQKFNASTSNPLESRPFAVQPKAEKIESPQTQGYESSLLDFAILNPEVGPSIPVQPKLTIGQPGDRYEQEADQMAKQVVQRINAPQSLQKLQHDSERTQPIQPKLMIQRDITPDDADELQMQPMLQLQIGEGGMTASSAFESSIQSLRGTGQNLVDTVREPMEQAFSADFSGVKIHTDSQADQLNQSIQAKAFTTGQDIFFRQGAYEPGSRGGQELIAHELTHVVQQTGSGKVQKSQDREIVSIGSSEEQVQRKIEANDETEVIKKYGNKAWFGYIKNGVIRLLKLQGHEDYDAYKEAESTTKEELAKVCEMVAKTEGNLTQDAQKEMAKDIVVPQSYYHVTKKFDKISALVTTGAGTCTGLAMSASNAQGEIIYALTHIDGNNDIPKMINGMIQDMETQNNGIVGKIKAYIASSSVKQKGGYENTPKDVVEYLKKLNVQIEFTSSTEQIRIGGDKNKGDLVRTGIDVNKIHASDQMKDVDTLIRQVNALPKMKGGHTNWEKLETENYIADKHEPMEGSIQLVLKQALFLQDNTPVNDQDKQQKIKDLKAEITKEQNWFNKYFFGKKLVEWAADNK